MAVVTGGGYRDALGLSAEAHTVPPVQSGSAFGLDVAQWDAWILSDDRGFNGVAVDLLEWLQPEPVGTPPLPNQLGFARLGFTTADLDATHARLRAASRSGVSTRRNAPSSDARTSGLSLGRLDRREELEVGALDEVAQ